MNMQAIFFQGNRSRSICSFNHTNQATNGDKDFSAHIHRALTRLKSVFITLYREGATATMPPGHRKICNDFYHPGSATNMEDLEKRNASSMATGRVQTLPRVSDSR